MTWPAHWPLTAPSFEVLPEPLEHVSSDVPILATRLARLAYDEGRVRFAAICDGHGCFDRWARATCKAAAPLGDPFPLHRAPHAGCHGTNGHGCGFYAVPADLVDEWRKLAAHGLLVTLLVELGGQSNGHGGGVLECERGYRAEIQHVVECRLPRCYTCGAPAYVVVFDLRALGPTMRAQGAFCAEHGALDIMRSPMRYKPAELEMALGVPVVL